MFLAYKQACVRMMHVFGQIYWREIKYISNKHQFDKVVPKDGTSQA